MVVGDGDSLDPQVAERLRSAGAEVIVYPVDKDESDTELAVREALARGATHLVILGALGGARAEHSVANLLLLTLPALAGVDAALVDGPSTIRAMGLTWPDVMQLDGAPGDYVSLLPLTEEVRGVTTTDLRFPLTDATLPQGGTRGLSNEMLAPRCEFAPAPVGWRSFTRQERKWCPMNKPRIGATIVSTLLAIGACSGGAGPSPAPPTPPTQLIVLTHDAFAISDDVLAQFEAAHGVDVQILKGGDAGVMVNKAILTKDAPLADVLYGIDNTFLSRALDAGIFDAYSSPALASVPDALEAGTNGAVTPIDYGDVCLNYDKSAFTGDAPPATLESLTDPAFKGKLVVENPATSSPGLAFLLATIDRFGETDSAWQNYWQSLRDNDVLVVNDWDTAYYTSFSGGAGEGDRPIVVSYATSPAAEVVFADPPVTDAPTGVLTDGCFRQVEYAGVLHGAKAPDKAREFVDYMLSVDFQQDIPLNMYVFPANSQAVAPEVFVKHAVTVSDPIQMDPVLDRGQPRPLGTGVD